MLTLDEVKIKSASKLQGLHYVVRLAAEKLIEKSYNRGVYIRLVQGLRTMAEQDALYAQGRTTPGPIVTKAKAGTSFHNFGVAIDFALLSSDGKAVSWDTMRDADSDGARDWLEVVEEAKKLGFEWGGDWISFVDMPHFQMTFGLSTAQYRLGIKPSDLQINKILNLINKEEDEPMTKEEKLAFDTLKEIVEKQKVQIETLERKLNVSGKETYAINYTNAINAAKEAGAITTSADKSKLELNIIQMIYNMGLFKKGDL